MSGKVYFDVELTDTFGGEANYCWVERATICVPKNASQKLIMRRAKAAVGLTGTRGRTYDMGDSYEFRPYRICQVMFVTWRDTSIRPVEENAIGC